MSCRRATIGNRNSEKNDSNITTTFERTFKSGEKLEKADLEEREMQYLYPEDGFYVFMDTATYDQLRVTEEQMGENKYYVSDSLMCQVLLFNVESRYFVPALPVLQLRFEAAAISCTFCMPSAVSMIISKPMRFLRAFAVSIWVTSMSRA